MRLMELRMLVATLMGWKKDNKLKQGGISRVLADGIYVTESVFTGMTTARSDAVKATAKPPLRSESHVCRKALFS